MNSSTMDTSELNVSAAQTGKTRLERLRKNLTRYAEKWTPDQADLANVCLTVDHQDEEWVSQIVDKTHVTLKQGVEHALQDFLNRTLESTDLQVSLDEIDELETTKPSSEKEAWRPSRVVDDDIQVYRIMEKQQHLLELQKELSVREDAVDETLGRLRQSEERVAKLRKGAEAGMNGIEDEVEKVVELVAEGGGGS